MLIEGTNASETIRGTMDGDLIYGDGMNSPIMTPVQEMTSLRDSAGTIRFMAA